MSIAEITSRLQSVNNILSSCRNSGLSFDDALTLGAFYRDCGDTNSIIEATEKEAAEDADGLLTDTVPLLSEIEKFSAIGVADILSVDFERLFEQYVKPFEERYEAAKAVSTKLWQEYSAISNRLDFLPLDSDEYKTLNAECDAKKSEYEAAHIKTESAHDKWRAEQQRCFCVYTFKPLHLEVLVARLKGIAESIIADIKRIKEEMVMPVCSRPPRGWILWSCGSACFSMMFATTGNSRLCRAAISQTF